MKRSKNNYDIAQGALAKPIAVGGGRQRRQYFLESKRGITPKEIAIEMSGLKMPDILIVASLEGLKMLKQIFAYQNPRHFDVYLATNQIGKTVEELELQNKELFTRLRELQIYVNDVYYVTKYKSNEAWVLGGQGLTQAVLPSRADFPGIGIFQDIVKNITNPNKPRQVWIVGGIEDWGFARACKGINVCMDVRYIPQEMAYIALKLSKLEAATELVCA